MNLRKLFFAAVLLVAGLAQAQEMPQMPVDPDVRIGKLDNGLTYYIRHNNWPENRANFYIAQKVGSIQEEESQRGLAHFLEHMCFNGTTHFPGNEVMRYCESIGVQFGRDLNAYTSIDQTVYNISNVPTTRQGALDTCLVILCDWANQLTLDPKEIDEERGVIHEEWRLRTGAMSRMLERNLPKLYPGSKYGERFPIGLMSVIDNFKPQELRDYYEKWYHPTNQGIIVVGNVDVDYVEKQIKTLFGELKNPANPAPIVKENVPDNAEPIVVIDKDKEQQQSIVELHFKHDAFPDSLKSSVMYPYYQYLLNAAEWLLNNRMSEVALKADCPFVGANAGYGSYLLSKTKESFEMDVAPKEIGLSADALKAAFIEARRAAEYGFTATEYERFKDTYLSQLEKEYSNKDKRTNDELFAPLKNNFLDNEPMPSIDFSYTMMKQLVPAIPVDAVNEMMKELVPANDSNLVIISLNNEAEGNVYPTEAELLGAVNAARATEISAYVDNVKNEPLITKLPKAGSITNEKKDTKLGYTVLTLSNGATVVLKQTDYKKDQVLLSGYGIGGQTLYGAKDYANLAAFDEVIGMSGLGAFSSTELQKALAGKVANVNLSLSGQLYTSAEGSSTPKDVETMMQMLYLYFTNIKKDPEAYANLMSQYELTLKNRDLSPDIAMSDSLSATMYGHNPRLEPLTIGRLKDISYDRILKMAKERTANASAWTFFIVGNYDEATIRPLICQYIGALPAKGKVKESQREIEIVNGEVANIFHRKQETPKANSYMFWHNDSLTYNMKNLICADIAGQVLSMEYLAKIREKESASYSVGAMGSAQVGPKGYRRFGIFAYCPMKPEKKDVAIRIMNEEEKALETTCDADKLAKCKEFMVKRFGDQEKNNPFWMSVISEHYRFGFDGCTDYLAVLNTITPQDICNFMKEFNKQGNHITVMMLPEE